MNEWISVEDRQPEGMCLVFLEEERAHSRIHAAKFKGSLAIVGGHFAFDMPKITHWMPLPEPPK